VIGGGIQGLVLGRPGRRHLYITAAAQNTHARTHTHTRARALILSYTFSQRAARVDL